MVRAQRCCTACPFLWTFHKVHHAITTMDFVGNFRFHWMEIVVYKTAQWLPLALLGASGEAAFVVAVFGTSGATSTTRT